MLRRITSFGSPYRLVTGNLGLSFLHAIGGSCREVVICDLEPAVHDYARVILQLIRHFDRFEDFFAAISRHELVRLAPLQSGRPVSYGKISWTALQDPELYMLYMATIGLMTFDPQTATCRLGQDTVHLTGSEMAPRHYSWRFGEGAFAAEETYKELRHFIQCIKFTFMRSPVQDPKWKALTSDFATIFLAGAMDAPQFLPGDPIVQTISRSALGKVRFHSFSRTIEFGTPSDMPAEISQRLEQSLAKGAGVGLGFEHRTLTSQFDSIQALVQARFKDRSKLIVDLDNLGPADRNLEEIFRVTTPWFKYLIFIGEGAAIDLLKAASCIGILDSYSVEALIQHRSYYFVNFALKGRP
jgi:hypothetical protein